MNVPDGLIIQTPRSITSYAECMSFPITNVTEDFQYLSYQFPNGTEDTRGPLYQLAGNATTFMLPARDAFPCEPYGRCRTVWAAQLTPWTHDAFNASRSYAPGTLGYTFHCNVSVGEVQNTKYDEHELADSRARLAAGAIAQSGFVDSMLLLCLTSKQIIWRLRELTPFQVMIGNILNIILGKTLLES